MPQPLKNLGNCPASASVDVNAIWYGIAAPGSEDTWPSNARIGGCSIMNSSTDRACTCTSCGHEWISLPRG